MGSDHTDAHQFVHHQHEHAIGLKMFPDQDDEFLKEIGTADYLRAKHIVKKNGAIEDILNYFK